MADRLALIIANGDFDDPRLSRLKTPTHDAQALAQVLGDPDIGDFDVTLLVDQPEGAVRRKIGRFYSRRKRSDLLLLYYSGHGIRDAHGDLYLATRDTEMDIAGASALSAFFVREQIDKSGSQRKVVVLDCCHSGAFAKAGLGDSVGTEDAFTGSGYGRVILTASDALELSWEGDEWLGEGKPSVFTYFLVEGLRTGAADLDRDGKIALNELYEYVYERVLTSGHARQTPHKWAHKVHGQIVIARAPEPDVRLPGWIVEALSSSAFSARLAAVGELVALAERQDHALATVARAELKRLSEEDDSPAIRGLASGGIGVGRVVTATPSPTPPPATVEGPRTKFNVVIKEVGPKKIQVIKVVRLLTSLSLLEAKKLVDAAPSRVLEGVPKKAAEDAKARLEEAGAAVELQSPSSARERIKFNVVIKEVGPKKIQVIKVVRLLTFLSLLEAKKLVDAAPSRVLEGVPKKAAEDAKARLEEAGAAVELQ